MTVVLTESDIDEIASIKPVSMSETVHVALSGTFFLLFSDFNSSGETCGKFHTLSHVNFIFKN